MIPMLLITFVSGAALLLFVLVISLLFIGIENVVYKLPGEPDSSILTPLFHFINGRKHRGKGTKRPPASLYFSCICLLLIFLFIPMGSLPQFVSLGGDIFVIMFLMLAAQALFIRGMRVFSGELYQSLDRSEINLLMTFSVVFMAAAGTFSWYALSRGIPGNIFCMSTYAAMPVWEVAGLLGRAGLAVFFLLFSVASPCRCVKSIQLENNVPLPEIFDAMRSMICPAMIAAMLCPVNIGLSLGLIGLKLYAVDFAFFWLKIMALQLAIIPLIRRVYLAAKSHLPDRYSYSIAVVLGVAGIALLLLDLKF